MKLAAGAFLAGATSRLLPASIPFRFFGAAVVFHALAWAALFAGADSAPRFAGGHGWPLAALHLITLGVLATTAIGASLQLLPVATRQPVGPAPLLASIFWLHVPGVAAIALGMGTGATSLLGAGAVAVLIALAVFACLLATNLAGARGMPIVVAHGWAALASLAVTLATAAALVCAYVGVGGFDRASVLALHVTFAAFGFMGMLAFGLSYLLVPMFALSAEPDRRQAKASLAFGVLALLLAGAAVFSAELIALRTPAVLCGAVSVALHLRLMTAALRTGMRRALGRSFQLVRIAWGFLAASLLLALGVVLDAPVDGIATLFGAAVIGGWLLTFLLGILQRIVPFLASMHVAPGKGLPPTPSSLTAEGPLAVHFACHLVALALFGLAVVADSALAMRAAALAGAAGAIAFGVFFARVVRRMARHGKPPT